jgi:hypothetical protein
MNTLNNNLLPMVMVLIIVAIFVLPSFIINRRKLTRREQLIKDAVLSFSQEGGQRRRYTSAEDWLIVSKVIKDEEMGKIIKRSKNAIHVRRCMLQSRVHWMRP